MHDHYSEVTRIARSLQDLDGPNVNPLCHTRVYTHGERAERSLVLLHSFTNCPQQFDTLGRRFFERGWNVVIPRYPRHGYSDRLNMMSLAAKRLPNFYMWWDGELKDGLGPPYGYPRLSTHAYAAVFGCGRELVRSARRAKPKARSLVVVTNAAETRLDNRFTYHLVDAWRRHGAGVETFDFTRSDGLTHDLIDPGNAAQRIEHVYPIVIRLIEGA